MGKQLLSGVLDEGMQSTRLLAFEKQMPAFTSFDLLNRSGGWTQQDC
jgi:hypothetical protein